MSLTRDVEAALVAGVLEEPAEGGVGAHAELGERVDVEHAVAVGVDADLALELGRSSSFALAADVDAEGLVDVVAELRARRRGRR